MMHPHERLTRRQTVRRPQVNSRSVITIGKLAINLDAKSVSLDGSRIHVTDGEYQMLELLALHKGNCVTRGAFMDYLYADKRAPNSKILNVFICKLRRKLAGAADADTCIETVWRRGYLLKERVSKGAANTWAPPDRRSSLGSANS